MEQTINPEQFTQVTNYILEIREQNTHLDNIIKEKKERMDDLREFVDKYNALDEELDELKAELKDRTKFVKQIIDFAEKASGKTIDMVGTLFENEQA